MLNNLKNLLKKNKLIHKIIFNIIKFTKIRFLLRLLEVFFFNYNLIKKRNKKLPIKVIIGAGDQEYKDWISCEWYVLNVESPISWSKYFSFAEIDNILAEHLFEHFNKKSTIIVLQNIYKYLKVNGCIRIAVPDGFFNNKEYLDWVKPNGTAPGSDDHKILYNYLSLKKILEENKFRCELIEHFDENNILNKNNEKKDSTNGIVSRSYANDPRNIDGKINYISLIIDAYKL